MLANAAQQDSGTVALSPLTPIKGDLINVDNLFLHRFRKHDGLFKDDAIGKAISKVEKFMKKTTSIIGGYVPYVDKSKKLSVSYTRIIKIEKLPAINEKHPQYRAIEGHPGWCIIVHQCCVTHPKCNNCD